MRLFNGTQPGRLPDEVLILTLQLIITQRALGLYTRDRTYIANFWIVFIMKDVWARADTEERPVTWSDIAVSRKRPLGT
ncbi:hypothetical protein B0J17DRAFT_640259 [Rhizoctonia solani]|nr:hypothetical protein B0J17DRAFT_640259 [Rhizoctonia solani]